MSLLSALGRLVYGPHWVSAAEHRAAFDRDFPRMTDAELAAWRKHTEIERDQVAAYLGCEHLADRQRAWRRRVGLL